MPFFRDRKKEEKEAPSAAAADEPPGPPPPGPWMLMEGPLYAPWYMKFRLAQEIARSRRYGNALSILIAEPQLIVQESASRAGTMAAAEAAAKSARNTDLIGWMGDGNIMVIMAETDAPSGRFAVNRLRDEMWLLSHSQGGQKWQITLIDNLDQIASIAGLAVEPQAPVATETAEADGQAA